MTKRIVIIGTGFAGMYSALSAARLRAEQGVSPEALEIVVVSPEPVMTVRPRLYEDNPHDMAASLEPLFSCADVQFIQGHVDLIQTEKDQIEILSPDGVRSPLAYDRLVLAAGSQVRHPPIPGLADFAFNVDQREEANRLWRHVHDLVDKAPSIERDTVVIAGGGFTGIETAAEFPHRMRSIFGDDAGIRVIIVEQAAAIGPDLGPGPRPVIENALAELGIEVMLGATVTAVDARGITLAGGERIETSTLIWTGGVRATPLTEQIPSERDSLGRLIVDEHLRVPGSPKVFATGDAANAATDTDDNRTLMSCQHAMPLGKCSGHNAAADLLGVPNFSYEQLGYATCLDLGPWGAVVTKGWDRQVVMSGAEAKALKTQINSVWIYPPSAEREAAFAAAEPGKYATL